MNAVQSPQIVVGLPGIEPVPYVLKFETLTLMVVKYPNFRIDFHQDPSGLTVGS